ncbi:hypothetical protein D3C87_1583200 [compost metagenome]
MELHPVPTSTVGAEVYPEPGFSNPMPVTFPASLIVAIAFAPVPPPPVIVTGIFLVLEDKYPVFVAASPEILNSFTAETEVAGVVGFNPKALLLT